jgi:hypothetical protein
MTTETESSSLPLPFKERFCQRHGITPNDFEKAVMRKTALPLWWLVGTLTGWPAWLFAKDIDLVTETGLAMSYGALENIVSGARHDDRREGRILRRWFGLRVSGRRLLWVYERL